jgi:hypothetical protein
VIKIELAVQDVNVVLVALSKLPYEAVADLINNIRAQAAPQIESAPAETVTEQ